MILFIEFPHVRATKGASPALSRANCMTVYLVQTDFSQQCMLNMPMFLSSLATSEGLIYDYWCQA